MNSISLTARDWYPYCLADRAQEIWYPEDPFEREFTPFQPATVKEESPPLCPEKVTKMDQRSMLNEALLNFGFGFVCNSLETYHNLALGLAGGAFFATASLVDTALRPMIGQSSSDSRIEAVKRIIVAGGVLSLIITATEGIPSLSSVRQTYIDLFIRLYVLCILRYGDVPELFDYQMVPS